jgi:NAD(P)-dependent dehydrogenase (short-subunit alcohol dehydrogenase family)
MPKTIVITGASDGIGAAAARLLTERGDEVVVVGRSVEKTSAVAARLGAVPVTADFTKFADVRALAERLQKDYPSIDVLANNAGGVFESGPLTEDGFEQTWQINHLAPFLLTNLLLDRLIASQATVIQTSSVAARLYGRLDLPSGEQYGRFSANRAYGDGKLANILMTAELHRRFHSQGIAAAAFHPGFIGSNFAATTDSRAMNIVYNSAIGRRFLKSSEDGADQLVWLASSEPGRDWQPGAYYERRRIARRVNPRSADPELARAVWESSLQQTGLSHERPRHA